MKAMFANLTTVDFGHRSRTRRRGTERQRVHALFDAIQLAIHEGDAATVDDLMAALADAIALQTEQVQDVSA